MLHNRGGLNLEVIEGTNANINLEELIEIKTKDKQVKVALKEAILCLLFVGMTMTLSYQLVDGNAINYRNNILNLFEAGSINNNFYTVNNFFLKMTDKIN